MRNAVILLALTLAMLPLPGAAQEQSVASPDGTLVATIRVADGKATYDVKKNGTPIVSESQLGLKTTVADFTQSVKYVSTTTSSLDETYTLPVGKRSSLRNHYNEATITISDNLGNHTMGILLRAYDDGFAYRYTLPGDGGAASATILEDAGRICVSNFVYCLGSRFNRSEDYYHPNYAYESNYNVYAWAGIHTAGKDCRLNAPALVKTGETYLLLSEAGNASNTCTSLLRAEEKVGEFSYALTGNELKNGLYRNVNYKVDSYDMQGKDSNYLFDVPQQLTVALPAKSPWRMAIVGTLAQVFESTLTENLCEKTAQADISWIKPGVAAWDWGGTESKYEAIPRLETDYKYVDFAAEMGWPYMLIDGRGTLDIARQTAEYGRKKGVEVLFWQTADVNSSQDFSADKMVSTLDAWKAAGIRGIKVDFWENDALPDMNRMEKLLLECAKRQMVVNLHGCTRPSGLRRTYPNLLTQEAVMGGEQNFWNNSRMTSRHHVNLVMTRNVVGPADYTPGDMADLNGTLLARTTMGHRMALLTAIESGIVHICESPENLRYFLGRDIMKRLPAAWDDSRLLEGRVGEYATIARRKGDDWWISGLTVTARNSRVNLNFLDEGRSYTAYIYKDGNCRSNLAFEKLAVNNATTLTIPELADGGYLVQISTRDDLDVPTPEATYEAEASGNEISGGAKIESEDAQFASGGKRVTYLGKGAAITFRGISATQGEGDYAITIYYATQDDRKATLTCNGQKLADATFKGNSNKAKTYSCSGMGWYHQVVHLKAGSGNTFTIQSPANGWSPNIDRITVTPITNTDIYGKRRLFYITTR